MLRIAPVLHEDALQPAARGALAVVEHEAAVESGELTLAHDAGEEVRPDLHEQVAQLREARGHGPKGDESDQQTDQHRQQQDGAQQPHRRQAGGAHDHQLTVAIELVEREDDGGKERHRGNDHHE